MFCTFIFTAGWALVKRHDSSCKTGGHCCSARLLQKGWQSSLETSLATVQGFRVSWFQVENFATSGFRTWLVGPDSVVTLSVSSELIVTKSPQFSLPHSGAANQTNKHQPSVPLHKARKPYRIIQEKTKNSESPQVGSSWKLAMEAFRDLLLARRGAEYL